MICFIIQTLQYGPRHAKRVFGQMRTAKSDQAFAAADRTIEHYIMYQRRANTRMRLCACVNLNPCILREHEDTFSLGALHSVPYTVRINWTLTFNENLI